MKFSLRIKPLIDNLEPFWQEIKEWLVFLFIFTRKRLLAAGVYFEQGKDLLVDLLLAKRGRYSKHFVNISFLFIVAGAIVGGPVIADYYPTIKDNFSPNSSEQALIALASFNEENIDTMTAISEKPRFEIVDYEIVSGDTLASIAEQFGISIDTIKWANNLKSDKLAPGQKLRIPPVTGIVHKVAPGDTIYSLAKKYKSDSQKIVNFPVNDFANLETFALNVGQIVFIPDGVMPEAPAVYRPAPVPQFIAGSGGKFIWPAQGAITQYPVSYHMAVDIANRAAPPIAAGDGGVVAYAGCLRYGYGCHVIINHKDGYQTLYGHLSSYNVSAGDSVGRGQIIGRMGSTGRSTGTHLHFEIRRNGVLLNPLSFLK